jgi:ATP-dependent DNA ligase
MVTGGVRKNRLANPIWESEIRLRSVVPQRGDRLLYCDHVEQDGEGLFRLAVGHDLEGIVAKRKSGSYLLEQPATWLKVRNRHYSQWVGREELFERDGAAIRIFGVGMGASGCVPLLLLEFRFSQRCR